LESFVVILRIQITRIRHLQKAQLPQRDRATRCVSKFELVLRDMGVRKFSNRKRNL